LIIGITGNKRCGKDTIATSLINNQGFERYSFAEDMKKVACILFRWTMEHIEEHKETVDPVWGISPRQFLQNFGTEYMQKFLGECFPAFAKLNGRNFWANRFKNYYLMLVATGKRKNIVISDLRFPHEEEVLRSLDTELTIVRVKRDQVKSNQHSNHSSEKELDSIISDVTIENNGSIEDLYNTIHKLIVVPVIQGGTEYGN